MQLLSETRNAPPTRKECAADLLEVLPGLMRFVRRQMRSRRAKGLSVPQFRTLVQLRRCPSASLSLISESLGSSAPTTSRIVSGLVSKGLIVRTTCSRDRRQVSLQLTARGRAVIDAAWIGTQDVIAEKLSVLSRSQLVVLARSFALLSELFPCTDHAPEQPWQNGLGSRNRNHACLGDHRKDQTSR
jgi:DNA-binding MarR family transcriptional regulator